jgi:TolB-like protein/class 3 adenylate cyclase/Flp pilus assembly protein TadD
MQRRLAAVLVADIAGYSRLVGLDEEGTHRRLKALRADVIEPLVREHDGRLVHYAGDGVLVEFSSAVRAADCALTVQRVIAEREPEVPADRRLALRIGLHVGEINIDGPDIHGDNVNIAARLEQLAEPGGVCLSDRLYDEIARQVDITCDYGGEPPLKNIARRIGVWFWPTSDRTQAPRLLPPADKPSIAVLPFTNLRAGADDDGLTDGIVEDLTTALARINWLFVVARSSTFALKGQQVDALDAGRRLGVRYLLEGSVRRAGDHVRITGQLIDASRAVHVWADYFDLPLDDLFSLQDDMVASVVGAIEPTLLNAEVERARLTRPENMQAHHYYLRASGLMTAALTEPQGGALDEARSLLSQAIQLDPGYAPALALAAYFEAKAWLFGRRSDRQHALNLAERAVQADPMDWLALGAYGFVSAIAHGDLDRAAAFVERALALNPNSPLLWNFAGEVRMFLGAHDSAIECLHRSMRLNPLDQRTITNAVYLACAHLYRREPEEAARWAARAVILARNPLTYRILAASLAEAGRIDEARAATAELLKLQPNSCLSRSRGSNLRRPEDLALYVDALRKAGLPEEPTGVLAGRPDK